MLSVLSTPCTKPATIQLATRAADREGKVWRAGQLGHVVADDVLEQALHRAPLAQMREALEGPEPDVRMTEAHENRGACGGRLVAALQSLSCLDEREGPTRGYAARLEHRGREDLANAPLQREPSVSAARPGRLAAPLRAQVEQPSVLLELREQKATPIAQLGVVHTELMTVIAERQRLVLVADQGLEGSEVTNPLGVGQRVEADGGRSAVVPVA
jgi:hypothetical protein